MHYQFNEHKDEGYFMSQQTIETYAKEKGIPYLLHFTRAVNLPSIMAHGIYPIGRTHEVDATPVIWTHT